MCSFVCVWQDTVVGLQAMATVMGSLSSPGDYSATLTVSYTDGMGKSRAEITKISKATESLLQKVYINYQVRHILFDIQSVHIVYSQCLCILTYVCVWSVKLHGS